MDDLRSKAKAFYNALDFDRPINFGLDELVENSEAQPEGLYVESIHGGGDGDPVIELADQIDFSLSAGAYLFTGNRGTGKTTELMRLAKTLKRLGCEVFYVDLYRYLSLTQRIEVTDFLISMLGALSEKVSARFGVEVGKAGFFDRAWNFLNSEVEFGATIVNAEDAVRRDMLPLADDDRDWLCSIEHEHRAVLPSLEQLPGFARLQQGKYILQYRNGEDWFAVHPLLREELELG